MRFSRLLAVAAALALSPSASFALPIQCTDVCEELNYCDEPCFIVMRISSCGAAGYACLPPASAPAPSSDELASSGGSEPILACFDA